MDEKAPADVLARFWRNDDNLSPAELAVAYGIDLSLIEENLRLSPEQRMDQNQAALDLIDELRESLK